MIGFGLLYNLFEDKHMTKLIWRNVKIMIRFPFFDYWYLKWKELKE